MSLIKNIDFENLNYKLVDNLYECQKKNTFSVIIGNNGVGKSRFFTHLIKEVWMKSFNNGLSLIDDSNMSFSKIIALTSSPFDKFPSIKLFNRYTNRRHDDTNMNSKYKYLGLKDDMHRLIKANGQLFKIIDSLVESTTKANSDLKKLSQTFSLLGYRPRLILCYRFIASSKIIEAFIFADTYEEFLLILEPYSSSRKYNLLDKMRNDNLLFGKVKKSLEELRHLIFQKDIIFEVSISDATFIEGSFELFEKVQLLRDLDLVDFKDLNLWKNDVNTYISIKETSSGERALLLNILGLASEIQDNTLICIDEPEISLHPEWQEKYMKLLTSTFQEYKGCHFVIATHSPKIISELMLENCFVLNMDENILYKSKEYSKRSSDYQLAMLFKSPGSRNEYLTKECVNILSSLSKKAFLTVENKIVVDRLIGYLPILEDEDPVKEMILIIKDALGKMNQ